MEWVETTGRTVADALDSALDELGVHEDDVEVEVVEEPKAGLFGRIGRADARVRVRLKPISREKPGDRRRRKGKGGRSRGEGSGRGDGPGRGEAKSRGEGRGRADGQARSDGKGRGETAKAGRSKAPREGAESKDGGRTSAARSGDDGAKGNEMEESTVSLERQAEVAAEFTSGLVEAFGAEAAVGTEIDEAITVKITGADLGLLVGPKGATLNALEELVRAVVQREAGGHGARIHVDVAGYREKRREALAGFTRGLVEKVLETGEDQVLEPMASPDRKVVHDTVAEINGVETSSEGEEPRRYVVIHPA